MSKWFKKSLEILNVPYFHILNILYYKKEKVKPKIIFLDAKRLRGTS